MSADRSAGTARGSVELGRSLGETDEFELIAAITSRFEQGPQVDLGPGDDAAVLRLAEGPDAARVVAATDVLVEGSHFRRDWSSAADIGHKSAAQNLADLAAMGARPTALLVGLAAPPELAVDWVLELAEGLAAESAPLGASIVGGDVVRSTQLVISVTVLGVLDEGEPVGRGGARPGDVVALNGRLGWAAAGLAVLSRGFRSPRRLVDAHRRPNPPYAAGPAAARAGASAMCDVSDGLVADAGHLAAASGVRIDLDTSSLAPDSDLVEIGRAMNVDPMSWVLTGGEDHPLLACFPGPEVPTAAGPGWRVIGRVSAGSGVHVDGQAFVGRPGHRHFVAGAEND